MPKQNVPHQLFVPSDKGTPDSCRSSNTNTPTFETEVNGRDSKRQKLNAEHGKRSDMQLDTSDYADPNAANQCAFCHSCRTTEVTGPLLHYYGNGKPVKVEEADQTMVIHVHDQCVDWTPRVYFDGETAMNLKAEVSRASKLRCSNCGQKGAALGCFYKTCRRSYHIPCAFGIPQCRWDLENYHVLCPQHSSKELPCDKSKSQKKIEVNNSGQSQRDCSDPPSEVPFSSKEPREARWTAAPHLTNIWILCGSALSKQDKDLLDNFANLTGATVTDLWKQNVTHVIASTDERGACFRTFKILMATLRGKWVLSIDWIKACMEAKQPLEEEHYEIGLDIHGCVDGPKKGRLRAIKKEPKIFAGLKFYFSGYFKLAYKGPFESLVEAAGGTLLTKEEVLTVQDSCKGRPPHTTSYVIYNSDPPQDFNSRDANELVIRRHEEAKALAGKIGARVVDHKWLVDSVAALRLLEPA